MADEVRQPHDRMVGAVMRDIAAATSFLPRHLAPELSGDEQAVALWEFVEDGRRIGLRVLIAPKDAWIGRPH